MSQKEIELLAARLLARQMEARKAMGDQWILAKPVKRRAYG